MASRHAIIIIIITFMIMIMIITISIHTYIVITDAGQSPHFHMCYDVAKVDWLACDDNSDDDNDDDDENDDEDEDGGEDNHCIFLSYHYIMFRTSSGPLRTIDWIT